MHNYQNAIIYYPCLSQISWLQSLIDQMSFGLLITNNTNFEVLFKTVKLNIHQGVYFMKDDSREVFETYVINGIKIQQIIGKIGEDESTFIWQENPNFIKRRSNFHGLHLKGMTDFEGQSIILDTSYKTKAPYFSNNSTYKVNDYVNGIYYSVLELLQSELNFTLSLFKRSDALWGVVNQHPNGSYEGSDALG